MIAGILPTRDYNDKAHVFERLTKLTDKVIVLDDNSALRPFPFADQCDIYLNMKRKGPWNCSGNRLLLMQMAYQLGCHWVLRLDDDMVLGRQLQTRNGIDDFITSMVRQGHDEASFECRELWDNVGQYRVDGLWGNKRSILLQRNWLFNKEITLPDLSRRLHSRCTPANTPVIPWNVTNHVYHLGSLTARQRQARVNKYRREDPNHEFQANYSYLTDGTGAKFLPTPELDLPYLI